MSLKKMRFVFLCNVLIVSQSLFGQTVSIDAEYRPRFEARQGFKKPLVDTLNANALVLQRTRLSADYKSPSLNAHITLQDARIWGQTDTKSSSPQVSIFEAWFDVPIVSGLDMRAGRQVLSYDDQRLFGAGNWGNTGNAHDALLLKYRDSFFQAHLGLAYNNTNDTLSTYKYGVSGIYQSMAYVWASRQLTSGLKLSVIGIGEGLPRSMVTSGTLKAKTARDSGSTMTFGRFTYGANLYFGNIASVADGLLTGYLQSGRDAKMGTLTSYMVAAKANVRISNDVRLQLGFDYYSGTSVGDTAGFGTTISHTFNRLYGTTHTFNGSMEYFTTLPSGGLIDYFAGATYNFTDALAINLTGHLFSLAQEMYVGKYLLNEKGLGSEADITVNYQYTKDVTLVCGYSAFSTTSSTTRYFSIAHSTYAPQWAYVMLSVRPTFFTHAD